MKEMNEELVIFISILSVLIAGLSLGWNVYRDVIAKPRINVKFAVVGIHQDGPIGGKTFISLQAVNMGPGQVTINMPHIRNTSLWKRITRKTQYWGWGIEPDFNHPLCCRLPHRLDIADEAKLVFPYREGCFLKKEFTHIGIPDSFGRFHWAPKEDIREAQNQYRRDFEQTES